MWGGNDATDMYVYNPSNFNVNYASTAGIAGSVEWKNISGKPSSYTPASHTHDNRYYSKSESDNFFSNRLDGNTTLFATGDLNNISNGRAFMYGTSNANRPSNYGTILTFGGNCDGSSFRNQIAISTETHMFFRININNGGWGSWIQIA